jgi:hypothetical protein
VQKLLFPKMTVVGCSSMNAAEVKAKATEVEEILGSA